MSSLSGSQVALAGQQCFHDSTAGWDHFELVLTPASISSQLASLSDTQWTVLVEVRVTDETEQ